MLGDNGALGCRQKPTQILGARSAHIQTENESCNPRVFDSGIIEDELTLFPILRIPVLVKTFASAFYLHMDALYSAEDAQPRHNHVLRALRVFALIT